MKRTDHNQVETMDAFRAMGATVTDLSAVGKGCPDLLVGYLGVNHIVEVKNPETGGKLNKRQREWWEEWRGGRPVIVRDTVDVQAWMETWRKAAGNV